MSRSPRKAKRAKISVYKPGGSKRRTGSASMVVLTPTTTRRGKIIYTEKDAAPYYKSSDEEGKSPQRKLPKTPYRSGTTVPASLEGRFLQEDSSLDDQEPHVPRNTKVGFVYDVQLMSDKK